jgi:hypothetical protein
VSVTIVGGFDHGFADEHRVVENLLVAVVELDEDLPSESLHGYPPWFGTPSAATRRETLYRNEGLW